MNIRYKGNHDVKRLGNNGTEDEAASHGVSIFISAGEISNVGTWKVGVLGLDLGYGSGNGICKYPVKVRKVRGRKLGSNLVNRLSNFANRHSDTRYQ